MPISEELLAIMACSECLSPLRDLDTALECTGCGLHYPVRDGIPSMKPEDAYRPDGDEPK